LRVIRFLFFICLTISLLAIFIGSEANIIFLNKHNSNQNVLVIDSPAAKSKLKFPFDDPIQKPNSETSPLMLNNPPNVTEEVVYDPITKGYYTQKKVGDNKIGSPTYLTFDEYNQKEMDNSLENYWRKKTSDNSGLSSSRIIPLIKANNGLLSKIIPTIDIKPQGSAELIFGVKSSRTENPAFPVKMRRNTTFDFQEKISMNVTGKIGDKIELGISYDTEALFEFENKMKLKYEGEEDDIIQLVEAGDVTLPLTGTLIQGSQSLFGFKTGLQFGNLTVTSIFSQQKGESSVIELEDGAQINEFKITADDYEANKHYFLNQYFKENYDKALSNLPVIQSGISITKIEVWITNTSGTTENVRDVVAFTDLGEDIGYDKDNSFGNFIRDISTNTYPDNKQNSLYETMTKTYNVRNINNVYSTFSSLQSSSNFYQSEDYEKISIARKLNPSEYLVNEKLGYISLNSSLRPDEALAVSYQYTVSGQTYQVGEFSQESSTPSDALIVKLIKPVSINTETDLWQLMMKNVYSIGAYQVNPEDFELHVLYYDVNSGNYNNFITEGDISGRILLQVLNLDNINYQQDPISDGHFDFINGVTVNSKNGRIYFPVNEPFGQYLRDKITGGDINKNVIANKYCFDALYDSTKTSAQQLPELNKFLLKGKYKSSSSSEISLNAMNIPQGAVKVTAGGIQLTENVDYTVDYNLGRVKIINEGVLNSGSPIKISLESNALFAIQTKTLLGTHLDYKFNDDFVLGGTILNLTEKPLNTKTSFGDEAISNTIWGIDGTYRTQSGLLTKLVDKIPFIDTKETSELVIGGEFAHFIPGHYKNKNNKSGIAYIDDFEGSLTSYDIKSPFSWFLSSVPQNQTNFFPEAVLNNNLQSGFFRAKLAWYDIDALFTRNGNLTPSHIADDSEQQSSNYIREILENEIFPNKSTASGTPLEMQVLNLAYYPSERGPYNYNFNNMNLDGTLKNPKNNWAGMMRKIDNSDFEAANIELVEFWMMDPFMEDYENNSGGDLYINLGNISEDILKDGRRSYEHGLPTSADVKLVDSTLWGRVPSVPPLVQSFDNNIESRPFQDVGLDGLSDNDENLWFKSFLDGIASLHGTASEAYQNAVNDPSADNFHYFRGTDYDNNKVDILSRYKQFNGPDGNSPTPEGSTESYQTQSTNQPDGEDINRDNNLSEQESYFQYQISLRKSDMIVGTNYITDKLTVPVNVNGKSKTVTWYQFKVPINSPDKVVGNISDFKSIRFMRVFLRNFEDPVICRFAKMDLVRGEWRKYKFDLTEPGEYITNDDAETSFDVSSVNIEENGNRSPIPYVLPPDIEREQIVSSSTSMQQLNEQSLSLKVCSLKDGDARGCYKTVNLDLRQYQKMKMYVHAEPGSDDNGDPQNYNPGDISVFIRLGSDFVDNYYEYEIPLSQTDWYTSKENVEGIWPTANQLDIDLDVLKNVKNRRNSAMSNSDANASLIKVYTIADGDNKISVIGTPNLSDVRVIMLGVKNPKKESNNDGDDGLDKCAIVWLNELRLTDFKENGGWAANANVSTKLADFGQIKLAGLISTPGFGSIEKKLNERNQERILQYDVQTNFELGKFFPEKTGISIPFYMSYSENIATPQYYPLDPDITLKEKIEAVAQDAEKNGQDVAAAKDSIRAISQDYTKRRGYNFTNVRKNKTNLDKKPTPLDISNLSLTYSYVELFKRDINTEFNTENKYSGILAYNYSTNPNNVKPFQNIKFLSKNKSLKLINDFNFYYMPSNFSFRSEMNKMFATRKERNNTTDNILLPQFFDKRFDWNRYYDLKFDITKSLKFDYSATNNARILEPLGEVNKSVSDYEAKRDTILRSIYGFGQNQRYNQTANINYTIPINKLPYLDWTSLNTKYSANYSWERGFVTKPSDSLNLGNSIQNSNTIQLNGNFNFTSLYNNIPYLKNLNRSGQGKKSSKQQDNKKPVKYKIDNVRFKKGQERNIYHNLGTKEKITVKVLDAKGNEIKGSFKIIDENKVVFISDETIAGTTVHVEGLKAKGNSPLKIIVDNVLKVAMSTKNASFTYSSTNGSYLPGYLLETRNIGLMQDNNNVFAPGLDYVFGKQDNKFPFYAAEKGWITADTNLNTSVTFTSTENFNVRVSFEPIKSLRIDLNATRNFSKNSQAFFRWKEASQSYGYLNNPIESGNLSMSVNTWSTIFDKVNDKNNYVSETFNTFKTNRFIIANRLAKLRNPNFSQLNSEEYPEGYNSTSQEVLMPAFLAAYTGEKASNISLDKKNNPFPSIAKIRPNWRISYNGLDKIKIVKKYFKSINIEHSFRSSYNIGSYSSNLLWEDPDGDGFTSIRDLNNYFLPRFEINSISITEQLAPLIRFDMTMNNNIIFNIEYKKTRNVSLSFSNAQLTEMVSYEFIIGAGYILKNVTLPIIGAISGKSSKLSSDLNIKADFSSRDGFTIIRPLTEGEDRVSAGQKIYTIKTTADYVINDRFQIQFFFDKIINKPKTSNAYLTSNTNGGISLRFTLTQ